MGFNFTLPLRIAQGLLTIIVLGLSAYVVSELLDSLDEANFLVFVSVWTILALAYLVVTPGRFPQFAHKYAILAVEAVTMIFWFAGFVALAAFLGDVRCRRGSVCRTAQAATVFGAFEWVLFLATFILAALHVWRTKDSGTTRADPQIEVSHA